MNDLNNMLNRRPAMMLLSGPICIMSHCCRIVLLEKDVVCSIDYVSPSDDPSAISEHNPYGETPTLLDRDMALYDTTVIVEYLDERFPHPPLMPVDPISRAKSRLLTLRLTRDWMLPINALGDMTPLKPSAALKKEIHDGLLSFTPLFREQPYFLGDEYTMVDAYLAALLWRLPALGIELPSQAAAIIEYGERLFKRSTFMESLSPQEVELREV